MPDNFHGHRVLDSRVLYSQGCYSRVRYWIAGHVNCRGWGVVSKYIHGITGKETEITMDVIMARSLL
jgi:hypothetical protein